MTWSDFKKRWVRIVFLEWLPWEQVTDRGDSAPSIQAWEWYKKEFPYAVFEMSWHSYHLAIEIQHEIHDPIQDVTMGVSLINL